MSVLKARFDNMQSSEVPNFVSELTTFFLCALELRSNWNARKLENEVITVHEEIVKKTLGRQGLVEIDTVQLRTRIWGLVILSNFGFGCKI